MAPISFASDRRVFLPRRRKNRHFSWGITATDAVLPHSDVTTRKGTLSPTDLTKGQNFGMFHPQRQGLTVHSASTASEQQPEPLCPDNRHRHTWTCCESAEGPKSAIQAESLRHPKGTEKRLKNHIIGGHGIRDTSCWTERWLERIWQEGKKNSRCRKATGTL